MTLDCDAVVVGSGPNGLAAAVSLARAGMKVVVLEGASVPGGGMRTSELTLPGFKHDVCSAIHPLAVASPLFRSFPLDEFGLRFKHPGVPLAHPLDDGSAGVIDASLRVTADGLGRDEARYEKLLGPFVDKADHLIDEALRPFRIPRRPFLMAAFGLVGIRSVTGFATSRFKEERTKALFAGMAAHSMLRLDEPFTAGIAMLLAVLANSVGWPMPVGGSQAIADALVGYFESLGGTLVTDHPVATLDDLPSARAAIFDVTPRQLDAIAGARLASRYRRRLRKFRYGPGVFKVDLALDGPIPWKAEECARAGTVHVGGTLPELTASEAAAVSGRISERPFVLVAQQSLFDETRAPAGKHTVWAYCHVPSGSTVDMTERIESQIERFAPGFRERIIGRHTMNAAQYEDYNPNYVGGDINGGVQDVRQHFARPMARLHPHTTSDRSIFLCSSSTPPGGGVHGLCGMFAAQEVLRRFG